MAAASPRMRGWTLDGAPGDGEVTGFPAHAGMDPAQVRAKSSKQSSAASPRMRGWTRLDFRQELQADGFPRMRGWTDQPTHHVCPGGGFPAHAGMDPVRSGGGPRRRRLPRACGDGPAQHGPDFLERAASPRMRGWTLPKGRPGRGGTGFPAHAGMDLQHFCLTELSAWLPRACGDGPSTDGRRDA